ncbi:hypothetical protein GOBAR_DD25943 [Gossypium barbadense]|nr:hypothetical protein GOBAR_DD25943 [Gossypium barbadense]
MSCSKARDGDLEMPRMKGSVDQESNTALHEAARCGNVEVVKALLEFEDPGFPYPANKKQETPLYIAARRRGSGRLLTLLLDKFTSTAHGGPHGRTALHAAVMAGDAEAIRVISKKKGNLTKERDEDGHTPLHYAAHLGCKSVVEELLKRDVSVAYIGDRKRGMTPVLIAARQGAFGMTPQEVFSVLRTEKHHQKQKQIKELLEEIENDQVADEPVIRFGVQNISKESLEKRRNAHLVVAAFIAAVAFTVAITVSGGLQSEKGSEQGTPLLIDEAAFKAFAVTNRETVLYRTRSVSGILDYATVAMMIAFNKVDRHTTS